MEHLVRIPKEKFTQYALNPERQPEKAEAFRKALGYTLENYQDLVTVIGELFCTEKLHFRGTNPYGDRFEQIVEITGPNGKTANVMTSWIRYFGDEVYTMTSVYVTKKKR